MDTVVSLYKFRRLVFPRAVLQVPQRHGHSMAGEMLQLIYRKLCVQE